MFSGSVSSCISTRFSKSGVEVWAIYSRSSFWAFPVSALICIDGCVLDKAVPDVDGHGVASDECVDVATLITELLTNDGNGEAELRPYFLLLSFVPVVEEARIEVVDVFCEVACITVATIHVLLVFMS